MSNPQTKRRKPRKKRNATKLAHQKFRWLEQLATDSNLSLLALPACIIVASKCSLDGGGVAIIGQSKIADKLGVWRQAVNPALRKAIALGHLEAIQRGRNKPNGYRMVLKDEASDVAADVRNSRTTRRNESRTSSSNDLRTSVVRESRTDSSFFSPGPLTEAPGEGERAERGEKRETPACAGDSSSGGGAPLMGRTAGEDSPRAAASPPRSESPVERSPSMARQERFNELRAIWARPWVEDDAADQRAFEVACREVAPEDIIDAARTHVAAADAPRYLPSLAKWLAGRGWEKEPPPKRARRSHANGRHDGLPRSNGNKVDLSKVFFGLGGYVEDDNGRMVRGGA